MQLDLDFGNKGWRRWAIDRCTRLRSLSVVEGGRTIRLNGSEAKILLYKIAEYDDCYASVGRLSDETGITKRNIERLLKAMREAGILTIEPRPSDRGHFPTNRYVVFYSEMAGDQPFFCAPPSAIPSATPTATPSATMADNKEIKRLKKLPPPCNSEVSRTSDGTTCHVIDAKDAEIREVEEVFLNLGIGTARSLVAAAIARGCATRSLKAIAAWWQRSQRRWPKRWTNPRSVLKIRLETATPNVPAYRGWIPGQRPADLAKPSHAKPKRDPRKTLEEARQNRQQFIESGESAAEELKKLRGW